MLKQAAIVCCFILLIFMPSCSKKEITQKEVLFAKDTVLKIITSQQKEYEFEVELAISDYQRERGMMYRNKIEENQGMLFVFKREDTLSFWMKNTYVSLDIIFIDKELHIVDIAENAFPLSEENIQSKEPAMYAFEVKGGLSRKLGINKGDKVEMEQPEG
ncbi:MAG: DUF192 domain-containing protein [Candidatus Cloacimonetes bacterium]|nr:DUF192 domain-containing protein [Candidatus Cloacimonadota bacterium]